MFKRAEIWIIEERFFLLLHLSGSRDVTLKDATGCDQYLEVTRTSNPEIFDNYYAFSGKGGGRPVGLSRHASSVSG